jgi:hypothetical protein
MYPYGVNLCQFQLKLISGVTPVHRTGPLNTKPDNNQSPTSQLQLVRLCKWDNQLWLQPKGAATATWPDLQRLPKTMDINKMEATMKACLDNVPLVQIQRCVKLSFNLTSLTFHLSRYANRSACFIDAYAQPDQLLFGQTKGTMDTIHSPLKPSANSRMSSTKSTMIVLECPCVCSGQPIY